MVALELLVDGIAGSITDDDEEDDVLLWLRDWRGVELALTLDPPTLDPIAWDCEEEGETEDEKFVPLPVPFVPSTVVGEGVDERI